jgi:hypothetical protein
MRHSEDETRMLTISDLKVKCIGILTGHLYRKCDVCVKTMASAIKKKIQTKCTDMYQLQGLFSNANNNSKSKLMAKEIVK